ncbi:unnamed protein product, partial [Scytosiphon promiscuus]
MTLRRFGVMPRLPLATPLPLLPLIRAALDLPEAAWTQTDGDKDELAEVCFLLFLSGPISLALVVASVAQAPQALCISSLPLLLEGHTPVGEGLPMFLLRLATEV